MPTEIVLVGTGPGPVSQLTREAHDELLHAGRVFFRMSAHPVYDWLQREGVSVYSFDDVYALPRIAYHEVYEFIAAAILKEAQRTGRVVYALPGSPFVLERTSGLIEQAAHAAGFNVRVIPGMSFLEVVWAELRLDPSGIQICNAVDFHTPDPGVCHGRGMLIGGLFANAEPSHGGRRGNVTAVGRWLRDRFPSTHQMSVVWTKGMPDYLTRTTHFPLGRFDDECEALSDVPCASAYIPPLM